MKLSEALLGLGYLYSAGRKIVVCWNAFQCFECENCPSIDENERDFIKECRPLDTLSTKEPVFEMNLITSTGSEISTTLEPSQSSAISSSTSELIVDSTSTYTSSSLPSSTSTFATPTSPNKAETTQSAQSSSITVPTTEEPVETTTDKTEVTTTWSFFPNSIEENELVNSKPELEDQSEEMFNWRSRQAKEVCYVIKIKYDGQEITKRGCGLTAENEDQTCQILSKGEPNSECVVCEGNLCNSGTQFEVMGAIMLIVVVFKVLFIH